MRPLAIITLLAAIAIDPQSSADGAEWSVASPDGRVVLTARLGEGRATLTYTIECAGATVLDASPLGIVREDTAFDAGLTLDMAGQETSRDSVGTLLHGKRRLLRDRCNERVLTFRNATGGHVELQLRAYDDGAAFRYRFPEQDDRSRTVAAERTGFRLPADSRVWAMPYDDPGEYTPAYENYWQDAIAAGTPSPTRSGWAFPLLFHTSKGRWGLITEAGVDGTYCGSHLGREASDNLYHLRFPQPGEGNGTGAAEPSAKLPWATPWRLVIVGESPATIVESTLVEALNPPPSRTDTSWVKPGRVSWSWLFDPSSPQDFAKIKPFVDLSATMGWEYTLVDANWDIMKGGTIHDVIAYAKTKGVGVFLWYNSGGPHNAVTERPRGLMAQRKIRRYEFERLAQWGVKGVKIDFFQSDKQDIIRLYREILEDAADFHIMVNFHGCTLPRGWSRTYPHLMSMEAVRGAENYLFEPKFPPLAPRHNTILPFTRNAVGPMDYTPTMFHDNRQPLVTTAGHEIALPVVFESGLLHFAGGPSEYRELPEAPKRFLQAIPVVWDETRLLAGEPGKFVVMGRRAGETWYVGGINGEAKARDFDIEPASLGSGAWTATVIEDGAEKGSLTSRTSEITAAGSLKVTLHPNGGFAATLVPRR
jgi:hypothetical protein